MANLSKTTKDHEEIKKWADARGGKPSHVKSTSSEDEVGILRIDFPGFSGEDSLEEISWDQFFEKFDDQKLALIYQEETADGEVSNFNKLVSGDATETTDTKSRPKATPKKASKDATTKKASTVVTKKAVAKKAPAKSPLKKSPPSKTAVKVPAKNAPSAAKKSSTSKKSVVAKKAVAKKAIAKKIPSKKTIAKKVPAKKVPAKQLATKKTTVKGPQKKSR